MHQCFPIYAHVDIGSQPSPSSPTGWLQTKVPFPLQHGQAGTYRRREMWCSQITIVSSLEIIGIRDETLLRIQINIFTATIEEGLPTKSCATASLVQLGAYLYKCIFCFQEEQNHCGVGLFAFGKVRKVKVLCHFVALFTQKLEQAIS